MIRIAVQVPGQCPGDAVTGFRFRVVQHVGA
jgi:hypothetical protein